ncbi:MAG: hypothetical protein PHV30_05870 [Candidatus Margulisbacteria bacterium]|nr:hypothetical protein [Candidatus Margulisiibacteriota bacterium]
MIKKYSTLFAIIASIIVFAEGLFVNLSYQTLAIRTILVFCVFYILGNLLGVITIEALLENQVMKSAIKKAAAKKETTKPQ